MAFWGLDNGVEVERETEVGFLGGERLRNGDLWVFWVFL